MSIIDRRGITVGEEEPAASRYAHSGLALKAPVACATTANITLSGLQTLDGVTTVADDRVLVKNQTDATQNGVYIASTGNWTRAGDFDGAGEIAYGTRVFVTGGTTQGLSDWYVSSPNPITIGSTNISLTEVVSGGAPASVSYVVLGASDILPSERVLAVGSGVTLTDGGAGGSITVGLDPTLVTIAGLAPGADQAIYFTGADTASLFTLTSAARSLLDDATVAAMRGTLEFATSTTDNGIPRFDGTTGGTQASLWLIDDSGNLCPITTDTGSLGTSSLMISDAFFALGAVINFSNGDVTLTHSADTLTLSGGVLALPNAGLQLGSSVPFSDSAGTLTLQNIDALDATTEATIEAAIDTLANLTSIQGQTVTISGPVTLNNWFDQSVKTTASPQFAGINLGHASDTTITRVSAGVVAVEGSNVLLASGLGSITQAWDANLDQVAALTPTDSNFIVGNGSAWVAESGDTARTSLGLGTGDSPQFTAINIGHASDTTLTRVSAGVAAIEGSNILLASGLGSITQAYNARLADIVGITFAQGDILYYNGTNLVKLTAGASGHFLKTQGAGANPVWDSVAASSSGRELLSANRTYYVRTDGSDSNDGLSNTSGGAFLTIQKAVDTAASLDLFIYDVTIQLGNGTYAEAVSLKGLVGAGSVTILGDTTTPSNVIVSATTGDTFDATNISGDWNIRGVKITTTSGIGVDTDGPSVTVTFGNVEFGACSTANCRVNNGAKIVADANYSITANSSYHWIAGAQGIIVATGLTITLTGTPAFSAAFAYTEGAGYLRIFSNTFSGSATGKRYEATQNGLIITGGAASTYLPGNAAGTTATQGQYL